MKIFDTAVDDFIVLDNVSNIGANVKIISMFTAVNKVEAHTIQFHDNTITMYYDGERRIFYSDSELTKEDAETFVKGQNIIEQNNKQLVNTLTEIGYIIPEDEIPFS